MGQTPIVTTDHQDNVVWDFPRRMGLDLDVASLQQLLQIWVEQCDSEVREMVRRQFSGRAKYYRPVTVFACHRSMTGEPPPPPVLMAAAAVEMIHNVSLIIDDILDRSRFRRGSLSLHCRFGFLPALMVAGYITAASSRLVAEDAYGVIQLSRLMQRLGMAECLQWRLRRQPLGIEDWRLVAGEDTGSMFETCARLGTRDDRLSRFGLLLGTLYHDCDDVADVRGTSALGGGSAKDIEDGILTLPAAIAMRDPSTAVLFGAKDQGAITEITARLVQALPEAERYLDRLAAEAEQEARAHAQFPEPLLQLIQYTRALSNN